MQTSKLAPLDTQAASEVAEESPEGERSGSKSARRNEQRRRARQRKREGTEEDGAANTGLEVMSPSDLPLPKKPNERNLNRKSSRTKAGANPLPFSRNSSAPGKIETKTPIMNWKRSSYASRGQRLHEAVSFMVDLRELGPELAMKAPNGEQRCGMFLDLVEVMLNEELQFEGLKSPEIRSITRNGSVPEESLRGIEEDIDARFDQSLKSEALKDFILTSYGALLQLYCLVLIVFFFSLVSSPCWTQPRVNSNPSSSSSSRLPSFSPDPPSIPQPVCPSTTSSYTTSSPGQCKRRPCST
jgi:hypothetical protein